MKWGLMILLNVCFWCCLNAQTSTFNIHNDTGLDQSIGCAGIEVNGFYWSVSRGYRIEEDGYRLSFLQVDGSGEVLGIWYSEVFPGIIHMDHTNHLIYKGNKVYGLASGSGFWRIWSFNVDNKKFFIEYSDDYQLVMSSARECSMKFDELKNSFVIGGFDFDDENIAKTFIIDFDDMTKMAVRREIIGDELGVLAIEFLRYAINNMLIIGYQRFELDNGERSSRLMMQELNEQDSVIWSYKSSKPYIGAKDALLLDDGKYVVVSTAEFEDELKPDDWRSVVICINKKTKEVVWTSRISPEFYSSFALSWNRMLMAPDSSGVILGGHQLATKDDGELRRWGAMAKISLEGDSIWYRTYHKLDGQNRIIDMEQTSDGGYIMAGTSVYHTYPGPDTTWFNTWMLKTDGEGRLIPDTTTSITGIDDTDYNIRVFPNPTTDQLYVEHDADYRYHYSISNQQGQVVKSWEDVESGAAPSYILDTHDYVKGVYFLSIYLDGEVVATEKVVIQ